MNCAKKKFIVEELWPASVQVSVVKAIDRGVRLMLGLALVLALPSARLLAQSDSQQTGTGQLASHPLRYETGNMVPNMSDSMRDPVAQQRQLHQLNAAKYKTIMSNTDKLLKLVAELNADIGGTNPASLTPEQLRKIAAIEKLARSVKDDMRTPVQEAMPTVSPAQPASNSPYQR